MNRRKEGLIIMVLGAVALALSAPWWLLGSLGSAGLGPRLLLTMGMTFVFLGFFWLFKRDPKSRPRRAVSLRVVPNPAVTRSGEDPRNRPN